MAYFDTHPGQFRTLFIVLAAPVIALGAISFYRVASRPTDENLFTNPPSNLYATAPIQAVAGARSGREEESAIRPGDLIVRVNDQRVVDSTSLQKVLDQLTEANVDVHVNRLSTGGKVDFRVRRTDLNSTTIRDLGPTALIIDVTAGGASDRAGMKLGDLILRINSQRFKNSLDADRILAEGQIGRALLYDVIRENKEIVLHVTIAAIGVPFPLLVSTLSGALFMIVAVFLGLASPRHKAIRLLAVSFLAFGYMLLVFLARRGLAVAPVEFARDIVLLAAVFTSIPVTFHAGYYFPLERPEMTSRKWMIGVGYALAVAGVVSTFLLEGIGFMTGLIVLLIYLIGTALAYRKKVSAEYKRLNRVVKIASVIGGVGAAGIGGYLVYAQQQQSAGYIGLFLLLIPAAHLYTIGRYRLFDLDLRVRRNVQYILVRFAWGVAVAYSAFRVLLWLQNTELPIPNIQLTATSIEFLTAPIGSEQRVWLEKGILMLAAVIVVYGAWRVAGFGRRYIDRLFSRARHDYRRAAIELSEVMATKLTMGDLARGMVEKLAGLLQLKRVGVLFFRDEQQCRCQVAYGFDGNAWSEYCIASEKAITSALRGVQVQASVQALPADVYREFQKHGFLYVIPIRSKEQLVGALLVGEKRSEASYQQEDLDFLETVAKQASMAIENAFLYEELAEQERMKHELAIARRIQLASLPQKTPIVEGLQIAGESRPALEVGGDYFDYLNGDAGGITVVVGDVSGKGTSAALYMSKVQGIIRSLHAVGLSPKELLVRTNQLLCGDLERNSFVTSITGSFKPQAKRLILARAGHLPLYRYVAERGRAERIIPRGMGLGLESADIFSTELEELEIGYRPDDVFIFASDGVVEAEGATGEQFGEEKLLHLLEKHAADDASTILRSIMRSVEEFSGETEQHDDQTIVVVKAR
jgi:serine phosphatase RsbU (regulator of sigma subunit)